MISKAAIVFGLLPNLISGAVICNFSVAANPGNTCQSFAAAWGLTLSGFEALNPGVLCPNLIAGTSYCVLGTVTDDPETTTSSTTTMPSTTLTTTTKSSTTTSATATTTASPFEPTQPGIAPNCDKFHLVASGDQCDTIAAKYSITEAQFKEWNTDIDEECSNLWLDYYVCVHVPGAPTVTTTSTPPEPTPTGPQPQMPGIISSCKEFYEVQSGDSCWAINEQAGITLAQFREWNKEINAACTNLWVGYYVCVAA
ncbi:hypothetical protein BJY04DRAFT_231176 [Aspergillus karnatakaensis]|uniref:LysM peptidoglycan-binding domain-containing protein n=1 Tax=Aspergillus karnatakaensis TaxID=1810916 RepID=UPI003CCCA415